MYKKISLFLVLVLVITTLSACAGSGGSNAELTEEKKKEIERAWLVQNEKLWSWYEGPYGNQRGGRYYGNYNGYDMFYYEPLVLYIWVTPHEIAGKVFKGNAPFDLLAYRNGKFYELEEIFKLGRVSRKSIAAMAETHKSWFPDLYED